MIRLAERLSGLSAPWRGVLCLSSGVAAALGLPPLGGWPLAAIGFSLFLFLLAQRQRFGMWGSFGLGWLFGLGYFGFAFHWIAFAFLIEAETYLWMMPFMLGILAGGMALYWGLAAALARRLCADGLSLALGFSGLLAVAEWLRGHLFTGFPWAVPGLIAETMGGLAQIAAVVGMTGLTLAIVLWSSLAYVLLADHARGGRWMALMLAALLPFAWTWGELRLAAASDDMVPGIAFRIVQPNVPQEQKWREDNARAIFEDLLRLSAAPTIERPQGVAGVTHLVWPESAVPFLIDESEVARAELAPLLGGRTALITGAIRLDRSAQPEPAVYNSIVVFDGKAEPVARYDKWRLVPGGEFLPLGWLLEPLGFRRVVETPGDFRAGTGPQTIALPGGITAAMLICYEAIFPGGLLGDGPRPSALINVTNDGWFGRSVGPYQHLAQARLRAIEQGLPVIRAANTGISAVIDSHGRRLRLLPLMQTGVLDSGLPVALASTPYGRWGDGLMLLLVVASLASALALRRPA
jgi:apolipoprotein N-acyltransferase